MQQERACTVAFFLLLLLLGTCEGMASPKKKPRRLVEHAVYRVWPSFLTRAGHTCIAVSDDPKDPLYQFLDNQQHPTTTTHNGGRTMKMGRLQKLPCQLVTSAKFRHGAERWWCPVHQGQYGKKAELEAAKRTGIKACDLANEPVDFIRDCDIPVFSLVDKKNIDNDDAFEDLRIWLGLPPAFDTTKKKFYPSIHVQARKNGEEDVVSLDTSFPAVSVRDMTGRFLPLMNGVVITLPTALEYFYYMEHNCPVKKRTTNRLPRPKVKLTGQVRCNHCGTLHEDIGDFFGGTVHKKHLCGHCGRNIICKEPNIGNPLVTAFARQVQRVPVTEPRLRLLKLETCTQSGLIQVTEGADHCSSYLNVRIWASTPAIFWSPQDVAEAWGIVVHAYDANNGKRVIADTYQEVWLDGKQLDRSTLLEQMVQSLQWMVQDQHDPTVEAQELFWEEATAAATD